MGDSVFSFSNFALCLKFLTILLLDFFLNIGITFLRKNSKIILLGLIALIKCEKNLKKWYLFKKTIQNQNRKNSNKRQNSYEREKYLLYHL